MKKQGGTDVTLNLLEKSPEAGRLLVKLHDKHQLYALANNPQPESRAELATIMADLLAVELTTSEKTLITDVLMGVMRQAEVDLRRAVSERLSTMENIPLRIVVHLANDEIAVADPILRRSRILDNMDLTYIVKAQKEEHWRAIANRPDMSKGLINALADTGDVNTAITLAKNKSIYLTGHALGILSGMAKVSNDLAEPLLMRDELPDEMAALMYDFVSSELKEYISDNYSIEVAEATAEIVKEVVQDISATRLLKYRPSADMIASAEILLERGHLNPALMVEGLKRGQMSNFISMFSVYCGLPAGTVEEMLKQPTAQGMAIACKAMQIEKSEFVSMFLLTSRARGGRIITQRELGRALAYYDRVTIAMARNILNQSRH